LLDQGVRQDSDEGYVQFWETGTAAKGQYHCADCGYGVSVQATLPTCPMCGGQVWEPSPTSRSAYASVPL
jgi:hypothetical protein